MRYETVMVMIILFPLPNPFFYHMPPSFDDNLYTFLKNNIFMK